MCVCWLSERVCVWTHDASAREGAREKGERKKSIGTKLNNEIPQIFLLFFFLLMWCDCFDLRTIQWTKEKINFHCEKRWRNLTDKQTGFFLGFYRLAGDGSVFVMKSIWLYVNIAQMRIHLSTTISDSDIHACVNSSRCSQKKYRSRESSSPFRCHSRCLCMSIYRPSFFLSSTHKYTWIKIMPFACKYTGEYERKYFCLQIIIFPWVCVSLFVYSTVSQWFSFRILFCCCWIDFVSFAFCFLYQRRFFSVHQVHRTLLLTSWNTHTHTQRAVPLFTSKCLWHRKTLGTFFYSLNLFFLSLPTALLPLCFVQFTLSLEFISFEISFSALLCTSFSILCIFACNFFQK